MDSLISVIVPVYKTEKYLPKCIESILKQTYSNFELILVDDGSPDRSGEICDEYAKKDPRIKVIHKDNEGVSRARNVGIENASGEFVCFVDSDDWINETALFAMISKIRESDADLVMGSYCTVTKQGNKFFGICEMREHDKVCDNLFRIYTTTTFAIAKVYKREIIQRENIEFCTEVPYGEDTMFLFDYLYFCKKICHVPDCVYYYNRLVENSAVSKFYIDCEKYTEYIFHRAKRILNDIESEKEKNKEIARFANCLCGVALKHYLLNVFSIRLNITKISNVIKMYKDYINVSILNESNTPLSKKIFDAVLEENPKKIIWQWHSDFFKASVVTYFKHYLKMILKRLKLM